MTTDITELAQSLKAAAEKATPGPWEAFTDTASLTFSVHTPDDNRCEDIIKWSGFDGQRKAKANAEFIAMANPANIRALVEALEKAQAKADVYDMLRDDYGLREKGVGLADFVDWQAKRIAELESHKAALLKFIRDSCYVFDGAGEDISDAYVDAITSGLMPKLESVAACNPPLFWVRVKSDGGYEGPIHDSKLEEVRKKSGEWLPLTLAGGIPELESRTVTVKLPEPFKLAKSSSGLTYYYADEVDAALTAAGIKVEAE
ncbi:TPA: ead/Ea22-like family protein [Klebsiella pneumoniae]